MTLSNEVREAEQRMRLFDREWKNGGNLNYASSDQESLDILILANAYLAEHDETEILDCYHTGDDWRDPWLLAVGFKPDTNEHDFLWINAGHLAMFDLQANAAGPWGLADGEESVMIPRPKTRGDVQLLCRSLGIKLRDTGATTPGP